MITRYLLRIIVLTFLVGVAFGILIQAHTP